MTPSLSVVDASVAVKWILPEPGHKESLRLLEAYESGRTALIAPSLLIAEVCSVLAKRCRRKQLNAAQARSAYRCFEVLSPTLVDFRDHMPSALELSLVHQLAIYDCLYLAGNRTRLRLDHVRSALPRCNVARVSIRPACSNRMTGAAPPSRTRVNINRLLRSHDSLLSRRSP
ncbi:MAG: type II toxin-antitoxin system VapC family toxin [Bryobacteraceae bacterium]